MNNSQQPQKKPSSLSTFFACCMKPVKRQDPKTLTEDVKRKGKEENLNILTSNQVQSDQRQKQEF